MWIEHLGNNYPNKNEDMVSDKMKLSDKYIIAKKNLQFLRITNFQIKMGSRKLDNIQNCQFNNVSEALLLYVDSFFSLPPIA